MAQEALTLHIQGMLEDAEQLPGPSRLEEIMSDPDYVNAIAYLVVSVPDAKPRTVIEFLSLTSSMELLISRIRPQFVTSCRGTLS